MRKLILPFLILFTLTSCESTGRVNDKNYMRAVEIDGESVTMKFFGTDEQVLTVNAESIESAKNTAELETGRQIFTGYTEMIIIKNCDTLNTLEYMLNDWKVSPDCYVTHTRNEGILYDISPEVLEGSVKTAQVHGETYDCDIITVLGGLLTKDGSVKIPEIDTEGFSGNYVLMRS